MEMNMTISNPLRVLALVGVLAVLGLGIALLNISRSHSSSAPAATTAVTHAAVTTTAATAAAKPAAATPPAAAPAKPVKPAVQLLPGLPAPVANALRKHRTVVVALYAHGAGDSAALTEVRAGAADAHTNFVGLDVLKARQAAAIAGFADGLAAPATLVVSRPGTIVKRLDGYQDRQVVAQAAADAR
jgi:hypothetical protein